jgi:SEC-C motif
MAKIGRNHPCPCGSDKKFKHCHGTISGSPKLYFDEFSFQSRLREIEAQNAQREMQQGLGRPIISANLNGQRIVAVGNRIYNSLNWKTFHDFLRDYLLIVLGKEWIDGQCQKSELERHQILQWFDQAMSDAQLMPLSRDGLFSGPMTGAQRAFLNLAYNIYLISHHSNPSKSKTILDSFLKKLKSERTDDFIGKLFETYASASFLKAGFEIEYENEEDGSNSHVEFVATYPKTGKKFSVEVKARNRLTDADGLQDTASHPNVWQKIKKALKKKADYARIVFVEVNIPDVITQNLSGTWVEAALNQIKEAENYADGEGDPYPPAYIVVTNHAFHKNLLAADTGLQAIVDGYKIADFGPRVVVSRFREYLENLERHQEIIALFDSLKVHNHIPVTFDGEVPAFAFGQDKEIPRLKIGQEYIIPNREGQQASGVLEDAVVVESWRRAQGIYRLSDGKRIVVTHELTEREWQAWREHPETFFGHYKEKSAEPKNWLEMAGFFFRTYKYTPKDQLVNFMLEHEDANALAEMEQADLAVLYCERMGWAAWSQDRE